MVGNHHGNMLDMQAGIAQEPRAATAVGGPTQTCPKTRMYYRVHPAIGIARVGNSDQFFIGPETAKAGPPTKFSKLEALKVKPHTSKRKDVYKERDKTKIRRQAARFRIFEYLICETTGKLLQEPREVTLADLESITWTVELANKKAVFFEFHGPNLGPAHRSGGALTPAKVELSSQAKKFNEAKAFQLGAGASGGAAAGGAASSGGAGVSGGAPSSGGAAAGGAAGPGITTLGHAYMEPDGRLVVLGGYGTSVGPRQRTKPDGTIVLLPEYYANNRGWQDDVSDGPVSVKLRRKGEKEDEKDVLGAWLLVGPPDYAPELVNVVSLYDTILDVAVEGSRASTFKPDSAKHNAVIFEKHGVQARAQADYKPYFTYDVVRLFISTRDLATVFLPAAGTAMHPKLQKLGDNTHLDDVIAGTKKQSQLQNQENQKFRQAVLATVRDPRIGGKQDPTVTPDPTATDPFAVKKDYKGTMPMLWGDSEPAAYRNTRYAIPLTLYRALEQYAKGNFVDTKHPRFDAIPLSGDISPWGLDRAALQRCVGGPFFPGIEASWLIKTLDLYEEPFRIKHTGTVTVKGQTVPIGPGLFSQQMAQPWQADFWDCRRDQVLVDPNKPTELRVGWWPAQRPDDVIAAQPGPATMILTKAFRGETHTLPAAELRSGVNARQRVRVTLECLDPSPAPPRSGAASVTIVGYTEADLIREAKLTMKQGQRETIGYYLKNLEKVEVRVPAAWKQTRITLDYGPEAMVAWSRGVDSYQKMVDTWNRLGFVVAGKETERDPTFHGP